ncbi:MAG: ACT domain-containing protein [Oscillospiraceae bacterium]|nr:ACT domain-containing protein [Oscillospiraceae bacterium]
MELKPLDGVFSICKVADASLVNREADFCFTAKTDEECSLVCPTDMAPENAIERDDGWRAFRIQGALDFSLIGVLARISGILAENGIGIFVISTFRTDYVLTKEENFARALAALQAAGYRITA